MRTYLPYLLSSVLGPLMGYLIYRLRARVDLQAREAGVGIKAQEVAVDATAVPLQILKMELAKREAELGHMRDQQQTLMTNHLVHDREEREALVAVLTELKAKDEATVAALKEVASGMREARAEAAHNSEVTHARLTQIQVQIAEKKT